MTGGTPISGNHHIIDHRKWWSEAADFVLSQFQTTLAAALPFFGPLDSPWCSIAGKSLIPLSKEKNPSGSDDVTQLNVTKDIPSGKRWHSWLVVFRPPQPEKYEFVNWDDDRNPIFLGKSSKWQPFTTNQIVMGNVPCILDLPIYPAPKG